MVQENVFLAPGSEYSQFIHTVVLVQEQYNKRPVSLRKLSQSLGESLV
jgi:hypothetical protein